MELKKRRLDDGERKRIRGLADTLLILLITIVTGTILIMACGADPAEAYSLFFRGIFGTPAAFAEIHVGRTAARFSLDLSLRLNDSTGKMQVSIRIFFDT